MPRVVPICCDHNKNFAKFKPRAHLLTLITIASTLYHLPRPSPMPTTTRSRANAGGEPSNKDLAQEHGQRPRQKVGRAGRASQQGHGAGERYAYSQRPITYRNTPISPSRANEGGHQQARNEVATRGQPLSRGGTVLSVVVQHLTLTPHFTESQLSSCRSQEPQREPQPLPPLNPIRNSRMGEPICPQQVPLPTSSQLPNTSVNQAGLSGPSLSFPRPHLQSTLLPQPTEPTTSCRDPNRNLPKVRRKPRNITTKGLKQSMGLHETSVGRHSYNRIRVRDLNILPALLY